MPIKFTVKVVVAGATITCNYKAASLAGAASNTGSTVAFSKQKFTKAAGSNSACLGPAFFSAALAHGYRTGIRRHRNRKSILS
jgi:hypothetical protein